MDPVNTTALNYHHLQHFWLVVREGGVSQAARRLHVTHPTVIAQVRALEDALGEKLFRKEGRRLVMTEMGRVVHGYAEEIFGLGSEMLETVRGRPTDRPIVLTVGIAEVVPKLVAKRLLDLARATVKDLRIVCLEDKTERLLGALATHAVDVVLSDSPLPPGSSVRAFNHLLGECGVSIFGTRALARAHRARFPASLAGAPMLLPTTGAPLRRSLDQWFETHGRPRIAGEFDDSALMKVFGQDGVGLFPSPTAIEEWVCRQYRVEVVGRLDDVVERFWAISPERRVRHPAVGAICSAARGSVF